jgi:hypothetical protein
MTSGGARALQGGFAALLAPPAFTQEAAAARLEAARLREQNTTLQTRLAELEARPRRHDTASIPRWSYSTTE